MPRGSTSANYACHWDYVNGPSQDGRATRTMMWICEYPYRTMRVTGPNDDCEDCPIRPQAEPQSQPLTLEPEQEPA